ncbi:MAG TPA: cytochrome c-type biogenesis protein [Pseudomonadales bacterium]
MDDRARNVLRRGVAAAVLMCAAAWCGASAVIDAYAFDNESQQARYRELIDEFRCPKCLNTNLAGSDAPIAADLRATVHRLILEGATDQAIRDYLQARYGDFVLYDPPVRRDTLLLWATPALLLAVGLGVVFAMIRRRRGGPDPLNDAERARLTELLREPAPARKDAR